MNNFHYISILGLLFFTSCKQECRVVKEYYDKSKEKEVFVYPDCNDTTYYKRLHFYKNGQLSSEGCFKNGEIFGKFKSWAENGNQTADWEILDGKENGFIQCWYDNGIKKRETTLDKGIKNGKLKEWDENGKQICEGNYVRGKMVGTWKYWEEDGTWKIRNYKNDTLNGPTIEHLIDSTSIKLVSGQYLNGQEVGLWKWFNRDSILYQTAIMTDGKYTGEFIEYYEDGKVKSKGNLIDSNYDGALTYYDEDGNITKIEQYKNGKLQPDRKK